MPRDCRGQPELRDSPDQVEIQVERDGPDYRAILDSQVSLDRRETKETSAHKGRQGFKVWA